MARAYDILNNRYIEEPEETKKPSPKTGTPSFDTYMAEWLLDYLKKNLKVKVNVVSRTARVGLGGTRLHTEVTLKLGDVVLTVDGDSDRIS